ncbi:hypothetical protein C5167_011065 [Papaver somniferum]|uniref:TFIIE beta domain-containing protein n=1 Tax=Papaver somniferum TaxID=3469 RepID=A0A4Y7K593_PAPSO|nr:uncharacterized protein LOC113291596 [Papaver somniferum]RZC67381.1 hypothetical protein C5167_011065 [Papaver somniferum]
MALQKSLTNFNQQQEKCLSTLSSINNVRAGTSRAAPPTVPMTTSSPIAAKFPTTKFSENTQKYQLIHSIKNSEPGAQVKRVIDLLRETRKDFTAEQIEDACYVDAIKNKVVFNSLTHNVKVKYDGKRFSYKPKHDINNKTELLQLIRKNPEGIAINELKDAYRLVMEDLQALKASGVVWWLSNSDCREDVAYPNDPRINIKVDDELKQLFRAEELPRDMIDIERYLRGNGMKPKTDTVRRRAMAQVHGLNPKPKAKKKPCNISKRTKLTNAHLPELFQDICP